MTSHYIRDHTTWFCRCLETAFMHFLLGSHNFMVMALGSCLNWPLVWRLESSTICMHLQVDCIDSSQQLHFFNLTSIYNSSVRNKTKLRFVALLWALPTPHVIWAVGPKHEMSHPFNLCPKKKEMSHPVSKKHDTHGSSFQISKSEFTCKSCRSSKWGFSFFLGDYTCSLSCVKQPI